MDYYDDYEVASNGRNGPEPFVGRVEETCIAENADALTRHGLKATRILVHGDAQETSSRTRKERTKPPTDMHLAAAWLKLYCYDRLTGESIAGVAINVSNIKSYSQGTARNAASLFGKDTCTKGDGVLSCKVLAGYTYIITATCTGYHAYGSMGECVIVTPQENETLERALGLVPVRVGVVTTLRELRPVNGKKLINDASGQVNPTEPLKKGPKFGLQPQRVSFFSVQNTKLDFLATSVTLRDVLMVRQGDTQTEVGTFSTDTEGHCFFYGPQNPEELQKRPRRKKMLTTAPNVMPRWEFATRPNGDTSTPTRPRSATYARGGASPARPQSAKANSIKEQLMSDFLESATQNVGVTPPGDELGRVRADDDEPVASGKDAELRRTTVKFGEVKRDAGDEGLPYGVSTMDVESNNYLEPGSYELKVTDPSRLLIFYTYTGDNEPAEITQVENEIVPFTVVDPGPRFVTEENRYNYDGKSPAILDIYTDNTAKKFVAKGQTGQNAYSPVQLYCRARPWFQLLVYDIDSLTEVGQSYGFNYEINRIVPKAPEELESYRKMSEISTQVEEVLSKQQERGRLARMWARAEVMERARNNPQRHMSFKQAVEYVIMMNRIAKKMSPDGKTLWKLPQREENAHYVPTYSGQTTALDEDRMWITPGAKYSVKVDLEEPFVEWSFTQGRLCNWELEPFIFYALKKVTLYVGMRERYNSKPLANLPVEIEVLDMPKPPRPPVCKPEWCETADSYANRILDQLIDYVVRCREEACSERIQTRMEVTTDDDGLCSVRLPPDSRIEVWARGDDKFEDEACTKTLLLNKDAEQFVGFQLERICKMFPKCVDCVTNLPLPGCLIEAYMIEDENGNVLPEPKLWFSAFTDDEGAVSEIRSRAGCLFKIFVVEVPTSYLLPKYYANEDFAQIRTTDEHQISFMCPPKPRAKVQIFDPISKEQIMGVEFRVMARNWPVEHTSTKRVRWSDLGEPMTEPPRHSEEGEPLPAGSTRGSHPGGSDASFPALTIDPNAPPAPPSVVSNTPSGNRMPYTPMGSEHSQAIWDKIDSKTRSNAPANATLQTAILANIPVMTAARTAPPPPPTAPPRTAASSIGHRTAGHNDARTSGTGERNVRFTDQGGSLLGGSQAGDPLDEIPDDEDNPWGEVLHTTHSGNPDNEQLIVPAGAEVAVELFPVWPYAMEAVIISASCDGWRSPPEFVFWLQRDPGAYRFWQDRDGVCEEFWMADGCPILPYHPLARLQPFAPPDKLLGPLNIEAIKIANPLLHQRIQSHAEEEEDELDHNGGGGMTRGVQWGDGADDDDVRRSGAGSIKSAASSRSRRSRRNRVPSAIQFDESPTNLEEVRQLAWEHVRLSDPDYLPLERTKLLQFLSKWGSFPHVQGGYCRACSGPQPSDTAPLLMAASNPFSGLKKQQRLVSERLQSVELSAPWAVEGMLAGRIDSMGRPTTVFHDPTSKTALINSKSQAVYCRSPFFTWWLANGGAVHVGMHEALYRELVLYMDRVAASLDTILEHIEKVKVYNDQRTREGRFLLGHETVEMCQGGVFIIDGSAAMPNGTIQFLFEQLFQTWDYWLSKSETPVLFNVIVASGDQVEKWRDGLQELAQDHFQRVRVWFDNSRDRYRRVLGFNLAKALRPALVMAAGFVPVYVLSGGLVTRLQCEPDEVHKVVHHAQVNATMRQLPMFPIHTVELYPMPHLPGRKPAPMDGDDASSVAQASSVGGTEVNTIRTSMTLQEIQEAGADVFERLQAALSSHRIRLVEVFREADKDCDGALDSAQLYRLVRKLVPDVSPAQLRYLQLMLDADGDSKVSYKELATALKAAIRGGIAMTMRNEVEVQMLLQKIAVYMMQHNMTVQELFAFFDKDRSGHWEQSEQFAMLKELLPGLSPDERSTMMASLQQLDLNNDNRISLDEFIRAFAAGGPANTNMQGWGLALDDNKMAALDELAYEEVQDLLLRSWEEHKMLGKVRAANFPLAQLLAQISATSGGWSRRLDLGHARACAEKVDMTQLILVRNSLQAQLDAIMKFEKEYGQQLTMDKAHRLEKPALTADPPPVPRMNRTRSARAARDKPDRTQDDASIKRKPIRSRTPSAGSRLHDNTFARTVYESETTRRPQSGVTNPWGGGEGTADGSPKKRRPQSAAVRSERSRARPSSAPRARPRPQSAMEASHTTLLGEEAPAVQVPYGIEDGEDEVLDVASAGAWDEPPPGTARPIEERPDEEARAQDRPATPATAAMGEPDAGSSPDGPWPQSPGLPPRPSSARSRPSTAGRPSASRTNSGRSKLRQSSGPEGDAASESGSVAGGEEAEERQEYVPPLSRSTERPRPPSASGSVRSSGEVSTAPPPQQLDSSIFPGGSRPPSARKTVELKAQTLTFLGADATPASPAQEGALHGSLRRPWSSAGSEAGKSAVSMSAVSATSSKDAPSTRASRESISAVRRSGSNE